MALTASCPRCDALLDEQDPQCDAHGPTEPLLRPVVSDYDALTEHLAVAGEFQTYVPWPLGPGWMVSDFGVVGTSGGAARASMTCCSGTSALDGPVDICVVAEEPATGLGARLARFGAEDPGDQIRTGSPTVQVRIGSQAVKLWSISISESAGEVDRSVLVGEAEGRWLWLLIRPASAILLLRDDWILRDISTAGPQLVEIPFGGPPPAW